MTELRPAQHADIPVLQDLIARSGRALSVGYYSDAQADAITRFVFGVDTQLIEDQTYFVIEHDGRIVACGGWSQRRTLFGGDQTKRGADPLLDPATEPARIRAFFVDPAMARRGLGRLLMNACAAAARRADFTTLELVSTLPGEPLYQACGFAIVERFELDLPGDVRVPVSRMRMAICGSAVGDYTHPKLSSNNAMSPNKQTVQAYMEAFTRTDPPAILACLTDDVEWVIPGMFHVRGKDAFEREIENDAFTGSPAITVTRMTEAEGVVVAEGTVRCARKAGGFLNAVFCDVFVMQDAKIRQLTSYLMEVGE